MRFAVAALLPLILAAGGCEQKSAVAFGGANTIIMVAPERLWGAVEDTVMTALEPRIFTVRDERTFDVTHVAPSDENWLRLREFKQVVLLGYEGDPWLESAVSGMENVPRTLPTIETVGEVWARDQVVTVVLLPRGAGAEAVESVIPELHRLLDERFKGYVRQRMYLSGRDDPLQERLAAEYGFSLLLPELYRHERRGQVHLFRNHYAAGSRELRRAVLVTWREGAAPADSAALLAWRDSVASTAYAFRQQVARERLLVERGVDGPGALQLQGAWETPAEEFPAGGPFIARAVPCASQDRTYLLDAWLYAPGEDKYEFMLQLENILDSFECAP